MLLMTSTLLLFIYFKKFFPPKFGYQKSLNSFQNWKKENATNTFKIFNDFRKLNNVVYFQEISPGVFEVDRNFELKSCYVALKEVNAIHEFCFRIRDSVNNLAKQHESDKIHQNLSNQEKKEVNVFVKNQNISICI